MNEEMKEHINALSMMLAQEGAGHKIIIDFTGGSLLSITDQEFNFKSTGLACDRIIESMGKGA